MPRFNIRGDSLGSVTGQLSRLVNKHNRAREQRIKQAMRHAAQYGQRLVRATTMPKAFGDLDKSLVIREQRGAGNRLQGFTVAIVADAPYAEAVEKGSRPHTPPLAPILAWVRLRGMQGLTDRGRLRRAFKASAGPTTPGHARSVAQMIRAQGTRKSSPIDAAVNVAKAIQHAISLKGTKPARFMLKAQPFVEGALLNYVDDALKD